jgi:DNA-binding MarR family transcriptional regulator
MRLNHQRWYGIPVRTEPPGDPSDDDDLADLFWGVARVLRHTTREAFEKWDVTPGQARALGVLTRHGVMRLSELSEHLRIAPRSTTEVVDALEERGLVQRRPDPHDRRATLVAVIERGGRVAEEIRSARRAQAERYFGTLSEDDRAHLVRILRILRD